VQKTGRLRKKSSKRGSSYEGSRIAPSSQSDYAPMCPYLLLFALDFLLPASCRPCDSKLIVPGDKGVPAAFLAFFFFGGTFSMPTFFDTEAGTFVGPLVVLFDVNSLVAAATGTAPVGRADGADDVDCGFATIGFDTSVVAFEMTFVDGTGRAAKGADFCTAFD